MKNLGILLFLNSVITLIMVGCVFAPAIGVSTKTIGYVNRGENHYSGVLDIQKVTNSISVETSRKFAEYKVVIKLTNLNDYPLTVRSVERSDWNRDNDKYKELTIRPGQSEIVYKGMGARLTITPIFPYKRQEEKEYAKIKLQIYGLNDHISSYRIPLTTASGAGP